jgi:ribosomal protein S18 acetylase RimI-like enzyme
VVHIRLANREDLPAVDRLIRATSPQASPLPPEEYPDSFVAKAEPEDILVASLDDQVVGFVKLGRPSPMATNAHVLMIAGLAVDPQREGMGLGHGLVAAAVQEAKARSARRLTLHVLGRNSRARALYSSLGFVVEGILREEFLLDGEYVDDVLMARSLT